MIDYFFKFASEAAAMADPTVQQNMDALHTVWRQDYVLRDVKAWRPSQDVGGVHTFLTGFFVMVTWPTQVPLLLNHSALQFALDRDGPPYIVKNNIAGVITDVAVSPIFAGSHYPIGGLS